MRLFDIIHLNAPEVTPDHAKVHLACWNGFDNPLNIFLAGSFQLWQEEQTRPNFNRSYIVALIDMGGDNWLFAGVYKSLGVKERTSEGFYIYSTDLLKTTEEYTGRVVVKYHRSGRSCYRLGEKLQDDLLVNEVKPDRMKIQEFHGYSKVCVSKAVLDTITRQEISSWKAALSHVAGVYLVTDTFDGRLYVGSATGTEGIWSRWSSYSNNGHGGNEELKLLLQEKGTEHANYFQYSILEIADTHASDQDVLNRESHWKNVLRSIEFGLNGN